MRAQEFINLNEAVGGNYVFHSRQSAEEAKQILSSGYILGNTDAKQPASDAQTDLPAVSVSRSLSYALSGANVERDYQVVFVIDRNALESRYRTLGTGQSHDTRGLKFGGDTEWLRKKKTFTKYLDKDADGQLSRDELNNPDPTWKGAANQIKTYLMTPKLGKEFEEIVPVKSGKLPLKGILVGFYLVPGKAAAQDPELLNHPLRLDMPRPNTFVKAKQVGMAEDAEPWDREKQLVKKLGQLGSFIVANPMMWEKYSDAIDNDNIEWIIGLIQDKTGANQEEVMHLAELFGEIGGGGGRLVDFAWAVKEGTWVEDFLKPYAQYKSQGMTENFHDGKKPGRKGLAKRVGVDCSKSETDLRKIAKNSSGERQRMAHWCANMKGGKKK